MDLGGDETRSEVVQSSEVRWYVHLPFRSVLVPIASNMVCAGTYVCSEVRACTMYISQ